MAERSEKNDAGLPASTVIAWVTIGLVVGLLAGLLLS